MDLQFQDVVSFKKLIERQDECVNKLKAADRYLDALIKGIAFINTLPDCDAKGKDLSEKQGEIDAARLAIDKYRNQLNQANNEVCEWIKTNASD